MYPRIDIYKDDKSLFSIVLDSDEKLEICENSFTWNSFKVTTNFDWNNIKNGFKRLIKEIDSQDMLPFRIIENREYILETNTNILLEIPTLVNEVHSFTNIFKPIPRSTSTDSKQFRLLISQYLGMMDLSIGGQKYILEIESEKLDFEDEFEGMLNDLNQDCVQLMQDWSSPTYMGFNEEPERQRKTLLEQFIVIRQTINSSQLKSWFGMIHQNPHQALVKEEEWKPIFLADPYLYLTDPFKYGREGSFDITEKYHTEIINIKKTISVDTPPNRFIKYVINEIDNVCSLLLDRIAASTSIKNNKEAISNEIKQVRENNRELLFHPFLKEIKPLTDFPLANQTLQKRSGYKEILYLWLRMQMASKLNWKSRTDFYESDLKNLPELYEYWTFFRLKECIESEALGFKNLDEDEDSIIKCTQDELQINLSKGKKSYIKYSHETLPLELHYYYNRSFKQRDEELLIGSYSRTMIPDMSLVFFRKDESLQSLNEKNFASNGRLSIVHFDAKYKSKELETYLDQIETNEVQERDEDEEADELYLEEKLDRTYKETDLYKMHTYKDSIYRSVGSYILYPGSIIHNKKYKKYFEDLPGVGAFCLKPTMDETEKARSYGELESFLLTIRNSLLESKSISNAWSAGDTLLSNAASDLYNKDKIEKINNQRLFTRELVADPNLIINFDDLKKIDIKPSPIILGMSATNLDHVKSKLFYWHADELFKNSINKKSHWLILREKQEEKLYLAKMKKILPVVGIDASKLIAKPGKKLDAKIEKYFFCEFDFINEIKCEKNELAEIKKLHLRKGKLTGSTQGVPVQISFHDLKCFFKH